MIFDVFNGQIEFFFYEIFSRFSTNITHSNKKDDKRINKQKQIGWMESNRTPHSMPSFFSFFTILIAYI